MSTLVELKTVQDGIEVQYEVVTPVDIKSPISEEEADIIKKLSSVDECLAKNQEIIDQLDSEIDRLTNKADGLDYTVAVASGVLAGMIDAFFVGEFDFESLKADAHKHVNHFIEKYAKFRGYKDKGKGLKGAITFLENKFKVDQDNVFKGLHISSDRLHHLEDLAHHPTILGMMSSIAVSFFRTALFVEKDGKKHSIRLEIDKKQLIKVWAPIVISGILRWVVHLAESKYLESYSKELPKPIHKLLVALSYSPAVVDVLKVVDNWFGHLVSDMGGSKNTPGGGMGIPGIFISLLKEISYSKKINKTGLSEYVSDLYSKDKWDLRAEEAIAEYAGKQAIPVVLNELLVRTFYFVRQLIAEYKKNRNWEGINWNNVVPWRNRTIIRMLTISTGTFMAVDAADAAILAGKNSGGEPATFFANMVLRINFVGIGRFAIALGTDVYMGYKRDRLRDEKMNLLSEQIHLSDAKVFYKEAEMWIAAKDAAEAIDNMERIAVKAIDYFRDSLNEISLCLDNIGGYRTDIEINNPELLDEISNLLLYGTED